MALLSTTTTTPQNLLFWFLIILSNFNQNIINSSSFSSPWLHHENTNLYFYSQSKNERQLSANLTYERFRGILTNNDEIASKKTKQEAGNDDQRYEQFITPRSLKSTKRCIRYGEKYLYQLLERSGMLNQWFMANNPEEAGRNFARSYENYFKTKYDYFDLPHDDSLRSNIEDINVSFICNDLCQNIIRELDEIIGKEKNNTLLLNVPYLDDAESHISNANSTKQSLTNCQLEMFVPVGKCVPQGAEEFEEHSKLCTSCHGVYVLDKLCFPRFINAIRCESETQTSGCIFDKISTQAHGSCYMRTLTFKVLRNKGSEECQEWNYEYIQVPTSCECQLDTESLLLSAVKP